MSRRLGLNLIYRLVFRDIETWNACMDLINETSLKAPDNVHKRSARFWFTEKGWNDVGRGVSEELQRRGFYVRVRRKKNPRASDVLWCDPYQIALLPT